jgi:hypothetical protein
MADSDEDCDRSRRPDAKDRGWSHRLGTQWPDDREVGDTVCGLHHARGDDECGFLG